MIKIFYFQPRFYQISLYLITAILYFSFPLSVLSQQPPDCATDEMNEILFRENPEIQQKNDAIKLQLREHARRVIQQRMRDPNYELQTRMVLTIPVVFHIMHNIGEAVGTGANITDARVAIEIANWNDAFRNIGAYAGDPIHSTANNGANTSSGIGISSVDVEIEFCLATQDPLGFPTTGVTRHPIDFGNPLLRSAPSVDGYGRRDRDMQAISNWPSEDYFNVWVVDKICGATASDCGVAGYAYFPGAKGQFYDGSVVEDDFIGVSANASKIMVHEAGHYLALYHTFQSECGGNTSDCTASGDDICDTPPDNSTSAVSCSAGNSANSCSNDATMVNSPFINDVTDMYENYMDYSYQSCQNTFTPDQKTRMRNALMNNRAELLTSTACAAPSVTATEVAFSMIDRQLSEFDDGGSDCRGGQRDLEVRILISQQPSSNVVLTLNTAGTATQDIDYELVDAQVTFTPSGATYQYATIRLFDDAAIESEENIILTYTISGPATAAASQQSMELTISDNDGQPLGPGSSLFAEDFESGTASGWVSSAFYFNSDNEFTLSDNIGGAGNGGITGNYSVHITDTKTANLHTYDNTIESYPLLRTPFIDASGINDVNLNFNYIADGESGSDWGRVYYRIFPGGTYYILEGYDNDPFVGKGTGVNNYSAIHNELDGQNFQLVFHWRTDNNGVGSTPFAIDDIVISAPTVDVETDVNAGMAAQEDQQYLGPNSSVYFYDQTSGNVMAKIENTSAHDYGCTTVSIDRSAASAGANTVGFWNMTASEYLAAKTFLVTPTQNNPAGTYNITLYYTDTEINNWLSATGKTLADLEIVKNSSAISDVTTSSTSWGGVETVAPVSAITGPNFGTTGYAIEGTFSSGFSGFGLGDPGNVPLPVEWISFSGKQVSNNVELNWQTGTETNNDYFVVERLEPSGEYIALGKTPAKVLATSLNDYAFEDRNPQEGINTYRLKQIDKDGRFEYSKTADVFFETMTMVRVHPNPFSDRIHLQIMLESANDAKFQLFTIAGKKVMEASFEFERMLEQKIEIENLPDGVYFYEVICDDEIFSGKIRKQ